ncbi:uncharacterized protein [Venturia canescens]|uniref:uncharacterized protein n=1 Tax=Venturia canescens TaxID=32260 RepID=UPI001C9CFE58|nr:uncharacterized protein LOC122411288 [Venturia canescens]XP_043275953.1 uncharacterized protein LOC122411288 [Venturia canescens]XP_043275962.1 uncharacterized protein LOC122411288 [Venturia canescens]XP_043275970.1 uncharacterized protein LOC122411288 [Venturia canescens]
MGFIDDELCKVSKLCKKDVPDSRLVSCVRSMVRVEITRTAYKKIVICIQFPEEYPQAALLIELKSKTLAPKFLEKLEKACEKNCKNILGKEQVLDTIKFVRNFVEENPLCCCYDEITHLKKLLVDEGDLKLNSKKSSVRVRASQGLYYYKVKIIVPDDYPVNAVCVVDVDTNFPPLFARYFSAQAKELGRRCVEPPLNKHPLKQAFSPSPSLQVVVSFIIKTVRAIPKELCQLCKAICLPENPDTAITDETADMHAERLYCGHLFHLRCLVTFMKTPPFHGGKKCPSCGERVYHEKWGLSEKLAEARWAHRQARDRELAEVTEFFE